MYAFKTAVLGMLVAASLAAQTTDLDRAQQALTAADMAGAGAFAKTLYDDAAYRARFAQENWNSKKESVRGEAHMRAIEATVAAQAAAAKARWLSTNAAIHGLQDDIGRFGGTSNVTLLAEESPTIPMNRGATTKDRIAAAQYAIDQAKVAGAMDSVPDNEIRIAEGYIDSAKRVSKGKTNSDVADDLAYRAEMTGRRAFYLARLAQSTKVMPGLQLDRTRLAQAASERQAAADRAQREIAERRAIELAQQLANEQSNRVAQSAELDRLRQQIDENRRAAAAQVEADRQARIAAERQLEEAYGKYTTTITTAAPSDVDAMRRQIEDQQLALRTIQERERANAESMQAEIARLRGDLSASQQNLSAEVLAQRQADILARQQQLDTLRQSLEAETAARAQRDKQEQEAIAAAQARRQQADAEAAALRQQAENAAQQAQAANVAAQQAQAAAQSAQTQLEETRRQLAQSDAETRRLRIQNELSRIASTRSESRGLIVTLNGGILFDTGKTALKPGAKSTLSKIAKQLQTDPSLKIAVEGHTDSVGGTATNQSLSEKRANAVRDYLVSAGISADHITADGKGEEAPIATNKTAAGRQQNRRVELVITQ
ncbi:MAG TPA: OmpA family protein [Thermoanaerobaculia bacterium]|jgi:outer membrane protein OmpA-like peptidoglycan-associated protein|nr:OmpA family protein [Thermoanaerobaculia bacterium]